MKLPDGPGLCEVKPWSIGPSGLNFGVPHFIQMSEECKDH